MYKYNTRVRLVEQFQHTLVASHFADVDLQNWDRMKRAQHSVNSKLSDLCLLMQHFQRCGQLSKTQGCLTSSCGATVLADDTSASDLSGCTTLCSTSLRVVVVVGTSGGDFSGVDLNRNSCCPRNIICIDTKSFCEE